ncbi:hypothetical protein ACS0TY_024571 [Phlomoides rotata]
MDPIGTAMRKDGEKGKTTHRRRSWSKVEEDALIQCLTDIVNDGWKVENSFKAEIFGKDRATGENAVDPTDLINDMYRTVELEQEGDTRDKFEQIPS